jgi:tetratricopeptide (TPR) repeat protein
MLLVWVAYWNSLSGGFHFDDQAIFLDSYILSPGFGWKILRLMQTRPLTFLTFHWNFLAGGVEPLGFHVVNVLLHAMNTILVMLIGRRLLRSSLSLLAGALFALHPLQTQAVNYVFERATLLAAFFALLSLLCFMQERYAYAVAAFALSLLAKEETIALPAFMLLYDVVYRRNRIRWAFYATMLAVAGLAAIRLFAVLRMTPGAKLGMGKGISVIPYALTQCRVVWLYFRLFLIPYGLNLDHDIKLSEGPFLPLTTLPALVLLVLLIGGLAWLAWRQNKPALWALGFFILIAPSSSVIPVIDLMFEHRTYFPLACLTIAAACLLDRWHWHLRAHLVVVLLAALLAATVARNQVWLNDQSLWADVVKRSPGKARGYFQLGQAYASRDLARARGLYEQGLAIEPENSIGQINLGLILMSQNDLEGALAWFRRALLSGGSNPTVWNNMGAAELRRGRLVEGAQAFRRALELDPCRYDARVNLMRALWGMGEAENAISIGVAPANCHLLPALAEKLEAERHSLR